MSEHAGGSGRLHRWAEVMPWFDRWLDTDEAGRVQLLAQLRDADAALHALVLRAIDTEREAEALRFLDGGALNDIARTGGAERTLSDIQGHAIGPWRIERLLGAGGMGQVWLVARNDGKHAGRAALKMLRFTALDRLAQQRFAREGELLARLQHPHVARLLDVGETTESQRYLVLEFVDGKRIDEWCDNARASIEQRLRLFLQVCEAIAYAHGNLIVHRDLKPSNILVQADGNAKVLDFGMAKLLENDALPYEMTELTRAGGAAFTPEYAAPEQFEGKTVTVATDVYSLGAVLYLLLTGHRPFGNDNATPAQLARAVAEDEPQRVSARVGETTGDTARVAAARATTPGQLRRALRGDLDNIISKALKKNPVERYATVQAFADDVQSYLDHRPISARADRATYRLRKYVRRHRLGVSVGALLAFAVVAGVAGIVWQANVARHEAERAKGVEGFLIGLFNDTRHSSTGANVLQTNALDLLQNGALRLKTELRDQPDVRDRIYEILIEIFDLSGDEERATSLAHGRVAAAEAAYGADDVRVAPALLYLAGVSVNHRELDAATPQLQRAQALLDRAGDSDSIQRARLWMWQGAQSFFRDDKASVEGNALVRAVDLLRRKYADGEDFQVALSLYLQLVIEAGRFAEAERTQLEMYNLAVRREGADSLSVAKANYIKMGIMLREKKFPEAIESAQAAYAGFMKFEGESNPETLLARGGEIDALARLGRMDEARALFAKADAVRREKMAGIKWLEEYYNVDLGKKLDN